MKKLAEIAKLCPAGHPSCPSRPSGPVRPGGLGRPSRPSSTCSASAAKIYFKKLHEQLKVGRQQTITNR